MNKLITSAVVVSAALTIWQPARAFDFSEGNPETEWRTITDAYRLDAPGTADMLRRYAEQYPTGMHANEARLKIADIEFFAHRWDRAMALYKEADIKGLAQPCRSMYSYRLALCMIKTGYYDEARRELRDVKGARFADVRNFYIAYIDYIRGDYDKAYDGFAKVKPGEKGLEAGYYMMQINYIRGDYEEVVKRADRMMLRNPVPELTAEIHRVTGLSYFKLDDYTLAKQSLLNYLEQNKGEVNDEALYALGVIDYSEGDYGEAARRLTAVTENADRGMVAQSAWLYLGQARLMQGDVKSATLAFEKASSYEADPEVAQTAMYNYITAQTRGGNTPFASSAAMLETYLRRWPDSPHVEEVREYLASAYFNDHDYLKAISTVDAARHPTAAMLQVKQKALYAQGVSMATNGRMAESGAYFEKASAMKAQDGALANQSLLWLGDANYAAGRYGAAARNYSAFIAGAKSSANKTLGIYDLAYAQYREGKYGAAADNFRKALEARPALPKTLADDAGIRCADCLYYTGDYRTAQDLYADAITDRAQDSDYAAYRHAMLTGKNSGQRAKLQLLDQFVKNYPQSKWLSAALLEKAQTHEELGEDAAAAEAYRRRLAVTPDVDTDELLRAAKANDNSAEAPAEQLDLLKRIRTQGKDLGVDELADLDLYEANALAELGRDEEADEIYRKLSRTPESLVGANAAVTLAERLNAAHEYQQAYDLMNEFTETGTPHQYWLAKGFIALADACKGLGRTDLAREYLTSLRDNYPGSEKEIMNAISSRLKNLKNK